MKNPNLKFPTAVLLAAGVALSTLPVSAQSSGSGSTTSGSTTNTQDTSPRAPGANSSTQRTNPNASTSTREPGAMTNSSGQRTSPSADGSASRSATGTTTGDSSYQTSGATGDSTHRNSAMKNTGTLKRGDQRFVTKAGAHGIHEVAIARIGTERATDPQVRAYAQKLVTDHEKANSELMRIASSKGVMLPASDMKMDMSEKTPSWTQKQGREFDEEFLSWAVDSHEDAIDLFERQAKNGADPELMAFAQKTLPELQEHLRIAKQYAKLVD